MPSERQVMFWLAALAVIVLLLWLLSPILLPFVAGAAIALSRHPESTFAFFGNSAQIAPLVEARPALKAASRIVHTDVAIRMEDKPSQALRYGRWKSSMWLAIDAVKKGAKSADVFISVAAVADYRVKNPSGQKIKKANGKNLLLELEENPDILAWVAALPKGPFCVGFAAESENLAQNAKAKLAKKNLPLIVGNLAQEAIGRDDSAITLYDAKGEHPLGRGPKLELARKLVEHLAGRLPPKK